MSLIKTRKLPDGDSRLFRADFGIRDGRCAVNMEPFYCSNCGKYQGRAAASKLIGISVFCDDCVANYGEPPLMPAPDPTREG